MIDTTGIDEVFARLEETDKLKQQAIEQLLDVRKQIDEKLARLGYYEGQAPKSLSPKAPGKKRHRRTKAELEAAQQADAKATAELPSEPESKRKTQNLKAGNG
jgi:hypothetical protein